MTKEELQSKIEIYLLKNHRYINEREAKELSKGVTEIVKQFIAEENLQKPF